MSETTNLSIRINRDLKDEADIVFNALGMNLTTAITIFIRQAVREKKIPFEIALYPERESHSLTMQEVLAASERIWQATRDNGTAEMSAGDIDVQISAARAERKTRRDH